MENNKQKEEHLYYNIQAIEICKKYGVEYKYSTSYDLTIDYFKVENVPEVIEELKALNCWTSIDKAGTGYVTFKTNVNNL